MCLSCCGQTTSWQIKTMPGKSLQIGSVTLYFMPIADAIISEDFAVPKVTECTAEWQRPDKYLLHIVLLAAYIKMR